MPMHRYALVVLLNINVAMASYGEGSNKGYSSVTNAFWGVYYDRENAIEEQYWNSLLLRYLKKKTTNYQAF